MQLLPDLLVFLLFFLLAGLTVLTRLLNKPAAASGALIAWVIWLGTGVTGVVLLGLFFLCGAGATRWKRSVKHKWTNTVSKKGADRKASQVWANGGIAALAGLSGFLFPEIREWTLVIVSATMAAACSDTLSSELGTIYGRNFFNSISGKPDQRGADGVVSLEGLVFGLVGAGLIALVYGILQILDSTVLVIWISGIIGNLSDSFLGAAFQRKGRLNNDLVNLLNTLIAAISGILLSIAFS